MIRVVVIHWKVAEVRGEVARLREAGYEVDCPEGLGGANLKALKEKPPGAFVIDLGRAPSQGRTLAVWLRGQKPTRGVPLLFIEGDPEKTEQVRKLLPDAEYTDWKRVRGALRRALKNPPKEPVVPGMMESYQGTPLPKKLGIKKGDVVCVLGAPAGMEKTLGKLPEKVQLRKQARGKAEVVLFFVKRKAELEKRFGTAARVMAEGGRIWIIWPKQTSGVGSDLTQPKVRKYGLDNGFVDYKIGKIDEVWTGLCFTRRKKSRKKKKNL